MVLDTTPAQEEEFEPRHIDCLELLDESLGKLLLFDKYDHVGIRDKFQNSLFFYNKILEMDLIKCHQFCW